MNITEFTEKLNKAEITFEDTMDIIESLYSFRETAFNNNGLQNNVGENSGSCKLFAFSQLQSFTQQQTLNCFGQYYHNDVMKNPDADNHQNIRNFIKEGWDGISFEGTPLIEK